MFLGAFLFWSCCGLLSIGAKLTGLAGVQVSGPLKTFVDWCVAYGDPVLILLAFANTHLHAARQWTPVVARRWAAIVLVASFGVETLGACTGFPFGTYYYTHHFGPLLGVVPMTIPLAWHVVVTNALFVIRLIAPHVSRVLEAILAGALCTLYDFILEPFATTVKIYWVWAGGVIPVQNYLAWLVISGLLVWAFAPTSATRYLRDPRPGLILGLTVLIFLAGRWAG